MATLLREVTTADRDFMLPSTWAKKFVEVPSSANNNIENVLKKTSSVPGPISSLSGKETITTVRRFKIGFCRVIEFIWDKLKIIFRFLFLTRSPAAYIIWLLILIVIILIVAGVIPLGKRKSRLAVNPNVEDDDDKKKSKKNKKSSALTEEPTNEGWRKRAVQQTTSGEPNKVDGYKRNVLSGGRCDGLNWITDLSSKEKAEKYCVKNLPPSTIRWEVDSENYSDLTEVPETWLTNNEKKKSLNIPYKRIGDRYYVDCNSITYSDGTMPTPKLFYQKNIIDKTCKIIERELPEYTNQKRLKNSSELYKICE